MHLILSHRVSRVNLVSVVLHRRGQGGAGVIVLVVVAAALLWDFLKNGFQAFSFVWGIDAVLRYLL